MRRNHMDLLKHQRDETMHGGMRGAKYSLKACIECHASQKTGSVAQAQTDFCVSCHSYAAVKIDCFECHQPPSRQAVGAAGATAMSRASTDASPDPSPQRWRPPRLSRRGRRRPGGVMLAPGIHLIEIAQARHAGTRRPAPAPRCAGAC